MQRVIEFTVKMERTHRSKRRIRNVNGTMQTILNKNLTFI